MSEYPCGMKDCKSTIKVTKTFRYICRYHTEKEVYAQFPDIAAEHKDKERQDVNVHFQDVQFDPAFGRNGVVLTDPKNAPAGEVDYGKRHMIASQKAD